MAQEQEFDIELHALPLFMQILAAGGEATAMVYQQLMEEYRGEAREMASTLALVRGKIHGLFMGPNAPTENQIIDALYPTQDQIERHIEIINEL